MYEELIKQMRSVYQEIDCPDCPLAKDCMKLQGVCAFTRAADAIEELTDTNVGKWIPVTERLPEEDGRYLVSYPLFNGKAWMRVAYFSTNLYYVDRYAFLGKGDKRPGFYYSDDEYGDVELQDVTHWMPLPQPPKEE